MTRDSVINSEGYLHRVREAFSMLEAARGLLEPIGPDFCGFGAVKETLKAISLARAILDLNFDAEEWSKQNICDKCGNTFDKSS